MSVPSCCPADRGRGGQPGYQGGEEGSPRGRRDWPVWPRRSPGQCRAPHPRPSQPWSFSACDTVPQEGAGRLDGAEGAGACAAAP